MLDQQIWVRYSLAETSQLELRKRGHTMVGKVEQGWYQLFLQADAQLSVAVARGEDRSEATRAVLKQWNEGRQSTGKKALQGQSFERILRAGRFLQTLRPDTQAEEVRCGYVQIELLSRLHIHSPSLVHALLPKVLENNVSAKKLQGELERLRESDPLTHALGSRNSVRSVTASHEKLCQQALATAGPRFFGSPSARIWKQDGAYPAVTPGWFVTDGESTLAGIFARVGSKSKDPLAAAFELYFLATNYKEACSEIWIIFPEKSEIVQNLVMLAVKLGGSPISGRWLKLATLELNEIVFIARDEYTPFAFEGVHTGDFHFTIPVRELSTGERSHIKGFNLTENYSSKLSPNKK